MASLPAAEDILSLLARDNTTTLVNVAVGDPAFVLLISGDPEDAPYMQKIRQGGVFTK